MQAAKACKSFSNDHSVPPKGRVRQDIGYPTSYPGYFLSLSGTTAVVRCPVLLGLLLTKFLEGS